MADLNLWSRYRQAKLGRVLAVYVGASWLSDLFGDRWIALPRTVSLGLALCLVSAACESDGTGPDPEPEAAFLRIGVQTMGVDLDPDNYVVVVDVTDSLPIALNDTVTIGDVAPGDHAVEMSDVASNCQVAGANPKTVSVIAGDTAEAGFGIECQLTLINRIVFSSDRDPSGINGLFLMNSDGSNQRALTLAGTNIRPSVAPGGDRVAFVSDRDGNFEIYVINADGSGLTRLTNDPDLDLNPSWSPDGTKIAFESDRDGNREIYVMNADGSGLVQLTDDAASNARPAWSPDGTKIAFQITDGPADIYVMNADGSGLVQLTDDPASDARPSWSPDGTKIAFESFRDGNSEIHVMNADGSNVIRLTNDPDSDLHATWSPDGTMIAFWSFRSGNRDIWGVRLDGTGLINFTNHPASDIDPSWGR